MMNRNFSISLRAIALGFATDMICTQLFILALLVVLLDPGSGSDCLANKIDLGLLDSLALCWGLLFTGIGGFVAARLDLANRYRSALVTGMLSVSASMSMNGPDAGQAYQFALGLTIPVALVGAHLAGLRKKR